MKEIYFVTGNKGKVESAKRHLEKYNINLLSKSLDINELEINNIEEISRDKALKAFSKTHLPVITLDAGFYIPSYPNNPNFPGAFPKRELLDKIGVTGLIENMKNVASRNCYFKECLSFFDGNEFKQFTRAIDGLLALEIKGTDKDNKWSELWQVFMPIGYDKTIAEFTDDEYEAWSRRSDSVFDDFAIWFLNR